MPLIEYCDWLEKLTESGDTISAIGLQKWIERYASEYHQSKLKNLGVIGDVIPRCSTCKHWKDYECTFLSDRDCNKGSIIVGIAEHWQENYEISTDEDFGCTMHEV